MPDDMGTFRVDITIENPARPGERRSVQSVLVDIGAELSWIPAAVLDALGIERYATWRFRQADGSILERWTGPAFVHVAGKRTTDDVVFGEPGCGTRPRRPLRRRNLLLEDYVAISRISMLDPAVHPGISRATRAACS